MNRSFTIAIAALSVAANLALAGPAAAAPDAQDAAFVRQAAQAGLTEVKLAQLALQKSKAPQVVSFATHMNADHSKANAQLKSIALAQGFTLPDGVGPKNQMLVTKLAAERLGIRQPIPQIAAAGASASPGAVSTRSRERAKR